MAVKICLRLLLVPTYLSGWGAVSPAWMFGVESNVCPRRGQVKSWVHRPWVSAGLWLQHDFGDGPVVEGKKTVLFVASWPGRGFGW